MNPWLAMALVGGEFVVLMVPVGVLQSRGAIGAEASRKAVHIGMGMVTLGFPWIFQESWPVLLLAGVFVVLLLALRAVPALQVKFGAALGGVGRLSWGEVYFPLAIGGLFALTHHEPVNYVIPVLILTFADAAAALAGSRLGKHRYLADEGEKSWEGSLAFFLVAFGCAYSVLLFTGPPGRAALIAACVALITMLLEATAWRGLDNLFVPFATLLMLRLYRDLGVLELWQRLGVLMFLAGLHWCCRGRTLLREGTLFGALLAVYLCWIFGGVPWVVAPITVIAVHPLLALGAPRHAPPERQCHDALLAVGTPPLIWLFVDRLGGVPGFAPFHAVLGAQLALIACSLWRTGSRDHGLLLVPAATALGWGLIVLPWWLLEVIPASAAVWSGVSTAMAALLFHTVQRGLEKKPFRHWCLRALLASLASLAAI